MADDKYFTDAYMRHSASMSYSVEPHNKNICRKFKNRRASFANIDFFLKNYDMGQKLYL